MLQRALGSPQSRNAAAQSATINAIGAGSNAYAGYTVATAAAGSAASIAFVSLSLAFAAGVQTGITINNAVYAVTGNTLGGNIYNVVNNQGPRGCLP